MKHRIRRARTHTIAAADAATHMRIVAVALVGSIVFAWIGIALS